MDDDVYIYIGNNNHINKDSSIYILYLYITLNYKCVHIKIVKDLSSKKKNNRDKSI